MTTVGGFGRYPMRRCSPPSSARSSSSTIFTMCCPGVSDSRTSLPTARALIRSTNARATRKLTSASSSATRTSRSPASTSSRVSLPRPLKRRSAALRRSLRESNIASARVARAAQAGSQRSLDSVAPRQLGGVPEALLVMSELDECPANEVVRAAPGALEVLGELGERPVVVEVQAAGIALVLGEQRAVHVQQALLTGAFPSEGTDVECQGQELGIVPPDGAERPGEPRLTGLSGRMFRDSLCGDRLRCGGRSGRPPARRDGRCSERSEEHDDGADGDRRGDACDERCA